MKYSGRIAIIAVSLALIIVARVYGSLYYNVSPTAFPFLGIMIVLIFWRLGKQYDTVKYLSVKDGLTGIYNRGYVIQTFPKLVVSMDRKGHKLSLFILDVDNFKKINDTYGHSMGDKVLQRFSKLLSKHTSKSDIVARWAGDEFLMITHLTGKSSKHIMMERIHRELKELSKELNINVTVSIGTSEYPSDGKTLDVLINLADQNMYELKSQSKRTRSKARNYPLSKMKQKTPLPK